MPPKHGHHEHDDQAADTLISGRGGRQGGGGVGRGEQYDDQGADSLISGRGGHQGSGGPGRGGQYDDLGADTLVAGRGGHRGGEGRGGHRGGGDEHMSPELKQAVENARQDREELANAAPENRAQCAEACKNSEAEVVRLGGNPAMIGGPKHPGGPGERDDKGADELIGGRGGHHGGRGGRGGHHG